MHYALVADTRNGPEVSMQIFADREAFERWCDHMGPVLVLIKDWPRRPPYITVAELRDAYEQGLRDAGKYQGET